ncbi:MAG TPA: tRNA (adenosine(37)-N6)-threonylcarbamoyltransferase complex dimerization subunit type 1 TsaB [Steroidobacteraceae bacterium]|jgi:tRNA threonylcarbamoyladenosine biosynthesis protein TsaB
MKLLALDSASERCSVALWLDGALHTREQSREPARGELLLPMIEELLREAALAPTALDAIAFGRGPGGFTGVRLAASVAQGLAFALNTPLLAISDLRALAAQVLLQPSGPVRALVCQDARMQEVYWGCFERTAGALVGNSAEAVAPAREVALPSHWLPATVCGLGSGFSSYAADLAGLSRQLGSVHADLRPRAREIALLAVADGLGSALAPDEAQPVYLRDDVARPAAPRGPPSSD